MHRGAQWLQEAPVGKERKREMYIFSVNSIYFFFHRIFGAGSVPPPFKVQVIREFQKPENVNSLQ